MKTIQIPRHPTRAVIDVAAFRKNLAAVRSYVGPRPKIMAVVKAEAYGHGMVRMAKEALAAGAEYLAVARAVEGATLRNEGIELPLLVFERIPAGHEEAAVHLGLDLTVVTPEEAARISDVAGRTGTRVRVHAKIDTGMSRLGMPVALAAEWVESIARLPHLELTGVYSHFATSEDPDTAFAVEQLSRFQRVLEELIRRRIEVPMRHMANSGAIMTLPASHFDMVRPGIMLYGYPPGRHMHQRYPLTPVMSLLSHVAMVKTVPAQTSVSYGRMFTTREETTVVTVPIGYADGFVRALRGKADAIIGGARYPVIGTICMDQIMLDAGRDSAVREGETVTLIGREGDQSIDAWEIAEKIGSIPYEVTCLITGRVEREYRGGM